MKSAIAQSSDCRVGRREVTGSAELPTSQVARTTFRPVTLQSADLIEMSYRLRYQTYCLEQLFLSPDDYTDQREFDAYDPVSVHVGVLNGHNELVGSARVVKPTSAGLPLFRYCTLFPGETVVEDPANTVLELSRVCIDRQRGRLAAGPGPRLVRDDGTADRGISAEDPFATLIKATYQATKRIAGTHWIVAMERSLRRRVTRYGLPFRVAGPLVDYHGPVEPYVLSLADLDRIILSRRYPILNDCLDGLEPEYWPKPVPQS